ncbi:Phosphatidylinositol-4 5-bisphosphate 3-kinase [Fasciola hepatica]|uniref:Phosphatidylinositol-4 5-bisphosphate 3-kinase n=1 Tax=Fasciola hepatica TaxID=6192 RepID=A0A4E0R9E9_FASHE|nr:Phosphatidylinositol-4 5-bisphosphate 3-kinase [Fasciola hepatica]
MPNDSRFQRAFSLLLDSNLKLNFLLPNGLMLSLELDSDRTLLEAKQELWHAAANEPLFDVLQPSSRYIFCGINRETADEEDYYDQSLRLRELPLLLPYLRVVEAAKDSALLEINKLNATIASCIGISHADVVRAGQLNPEIGWSRTRLQRLAEEHYKALHSTGTLGLARYLTAAPRRAISKSLKDQLSTLSTLEVTAWMFDGDEPSSQERPIAASVDLNATVLDVLTELLNIQTELARTSYAMAIRDLGVTIQAPNPLDYALKVCCSQAYLFDLDVPLIAYEYIQECIEQGHTPCLSPVLRRDVCETLACPLSDSNGLLASTPECMHGIKADQLPSVTTPSVRKPIRLLGSSDLSFKSNPSTESDIYGPVEQLVRESDDTAVTCDREWPDTTPATAYSSNSSENLSGGSISQSKRAKPPVFSLWELNGYLSVKVCSGQFLSETLSLTSSGQSQSLLSSSPSLNRINAPNQGNSAGNSMQGSPAAATFNSAFQSEYVVRVGLFHGTQSLIEYRTTGGRSGPYFSWNEWLYFHMQLADIPPAARLCVALVKFERSTEKRSTKVYEYPVGWANLNFFDPLGYMISGDITLRLWPASLLQSTEERFNRMHPSGTVLENPNPDFSLQIMIHSPVRGLIRRPSLRAYLDAFRGLTGSLNHNSMSRPSVASLPAGRARVVSPTSATFTNPVFGTGDVEEEDIDEFVLVEMPPGNAAPNEFDVAEYEPVLRELATRDPLYELSEQEKGALWRGRYYCRDNLPMLLPWLVQSMCWYRRASVCEFYALLESWPRPLHISVALQLLGAMGLNSSGASETGAVLGAAAAVTGSGRGGASGVADLHVRELAVRSLYVLDDSELSDYLLQLVQALKAEAYLDNSLSRFILYRALRNPVQIGLRFFWHLRSEIHLPDIRLRFGLLLEAFCRGCGPLLIFLGRQVTTLNRLETISARVKELTSEEEQRSRFRDEVSRPEAKRDLQWVPSPLCLNERLGKLLVPKCDVKRSKKRPLWLVWTNSDRLAVHHHQNYQLIFKHGDDLRQDMLTLNLLRVMDRIWKEEGLDMCLVPYACLATGPDMGLIEAVRNARTVMSIQNDRLRAALQIDSTQLYRWLTQEQYAGRDGLSQNGTTYEQTIQNFTRSCAGYCVATFVLGIRDRHPDNIMVDTSGRLFHIDFGHILDNRKKKFGITRERVPFVLTKDFITVIARGNPDVVLGAPVTATGGGSSNVQFQKFARLCERAYVMLRKHSNLLLTLFAMMLPSGLPELTSVCDLDYVRRTLAVDMSDQEALNYFHSKFNEAYYGAWTTKIDWFSHWVNT